MFDGHLLELLLIYQYVSFAYLSSEYLYSTHSVVHAFAVTEFV